MNLAMLSQNQEREIQPNANSDWIWEVGCL